ncbi:LysR family transcriptional regulator [Francisella adeliensis]|uniref:LysR family transcriptional regulator n=1 Tax=Francisella adeliensis TaxID=2007306 RepID=A0A2Z4XY56_9GAMM|nr:LysR family transcriptional regulator [Francisella adeliensis]AXA33719.1 LysR family transcriptional regulator [Francisella adeliensis]MBK2085615.1 LysR family transcriptional regulator [Francisella adeliensis]MBK2097493.1 LysR family transcriptional regulator [Francisella adeliensis]QIW11953.1 LysR family transcriptional regulator [Francisella adeliensis]QIW13829.1 LysR family transcriptional regulator [Francisella adeliensis]
MKMLDELKLFIAVVNQGSLSAAGREFYLSPASISNKINALEEYYQTKLLIRTTRKIEPTKAGETLYSESIKLLEQLNAVKDNILNDKISAEGSIKITVPFDLGQRLVLPILKRFKEENPNIEYDILFTDDVVSYNQFPFDLAIRFGNLPDSSFISKHLVDNYRILCASPEYLQKNNISNINDINAIKKCQFITLKINSFTIKKWYLIDDERNKIELNINAAYIVNNGYIIRKMCLEGFGVAEKSYWDIKDDLASGRIVQILPKYKVLFDPKDKPDNRISLVYPSRNYQPYRVRMLSDFIKNEFLNL